jgi:pilus assembly protein CpaB
MKSRLLGGILALVLAIAGTVMLVSYVSQADRRAQAALDPVDVVVIESAVPAGTTAEELKSHIQVRSIPGAAKADDALSSLTAAAGLVTSVTLEPGEQLLASRMIDPSQQVTPGAVEVPADMQEVTVLLPPESVVGGTVRAGDLVGLFVTRTDPSNPDVASTALVFDKVLVTAVQQAPPSDEQTAEGTSAIPSGSTFVTFARNSTDAAKIILSARTGNIWLTKQTAKTPVSDRTLVSSTGIFQ